MFLTKFYLVFDCLFKRISDDAEKRKGRIAVANNESMLLGLTFLFRVKF